MVRNLAPVDKNFVNGQFDLRLAEAQAAQKTGDILAATREYNEMAADFRTYREMKEQETLAKSLADSAEFRKARKNEKAALDLQDETAMKIGNLVLGISQRTDERTAFVSQLQTVVADSYRDQRREGANPARKQAIERGMASAFSYAVESGQQAMLKQDYLAAKDMFQAGEIILPDSAWACYLLATAHAQLGEKKQAIQELKKALEKGMTSVKALDDDAFDHIREDEGFKEIAAKLRGLPKSSK
jgi:tetratricopeptide (TPR) repeat protein